MTTTPRHNFSDFVVWLLRGIFTFGIYTAFWSWRVAERVSDAAHRFLDGEAK